MAAKFHATFCSGDDERKSYWNSKHVVLFMLWYFLGENLLFNILASMTRAFHLSSSTHEKYMERENCVGEKKSNWKKFRVNEILKFLVRILFQPNFSGFFTFLWFIFFHIKFFLEILINFKLCNLISASKWKIFSRSECWKILFCSSSRWTRKKFEK